MREAVGAGVVCTRGAEGALFAVAGARPAPSPAPPVRVVDTTGCRRHLRGYLCARWVTGRRRPTGESIEFATDAASLTVTRPGAAAAIPSRSAVADFLPDNRKDHRR